MSGRPPRKTGRPFRFGGSRIARLIGAPLAAGHYKGGFGFNPPIATCGREVLAGVLRPGNAGANNAAEHLRVLELALEQLPESALDGEIRARSDSAGTSPDFAGACRILHVAGQITHHARRTTLHLPADWPWATAILRAFKRLQALPAHG